MTLIAPGKHPLLPSPPPVLQQDDNLEVVKSHDDNAGTSLDLRCLMTISYKHFDTRVRVFRIQDVQHALCDVYQVRAAELEALFDHYVLDFSRGSIFVTAKPSVVEASPHIHLLDCTKERQMVQSDDFYGGFVDVCHHLNV